MRFVLQYLRPICAMLQTKCYARNQTVITRIDDFNFGRRSFYTLESGRRKVVLPTQTRGKHTHEIHSPEKPKKRERSKNILSITPLLTVPSILMHVSGHSGL